MRKQYYFRDSPRGLLAWDVDRLAPDYVGCDPDELPYQDE